MIINGFAARGFQYTARWFCVAVLASLAWVAVAQEEASVLDRTLKGQRLNELAAWRLGSDPVFKIFATDTAGNVACYAADTLDEIWERRISAGSLTAPVIGDFMRTGAPILAFGSTSGGVYFMWPGSGELVASIDTDLSFVTAPSIAARANGDEIIFADIKGYVAGYALTPEGIVYETFRIENSTDDAAAIQGVGAITQPPSSADLNGDGQPEILVTSETGLVQVLSLTADENQAPARHLHRIPQNTEASTLAAMGRFSEAGPDVFGFGIGSTLHFFTFDPAAQPKMVIRPFLQAGAYGNSYGHLLLGEVNADDAPDLISTAHSTVAARYRGYDLAGGETLLDITPNQLSTQSPSFSPAVPVTLASGAKAVVAIDSSGTAFVWQPDVQDSSARRISGLPLPTMFTPAGNLAGTGKLTLIIWNEQTFTLSSATLPVDVAPVADAPPAVTLGVNYSRNGQWGRAWQQEYADRMARADSALQKAKGLPATSSDSNSTTDAISIIAGIAPEDPLADRLKVGRRSGMSTGIVNTAGAIVIIALLIGTIYFLWRKFRHRH